MPISISQCLVGLIMRSLLVSVQPSPAQTDRWNRGAHSAPYVKSQTTVKTFFYYYTAHIRRTTSLHVIRLSSLCAQTGVWASTHERRASSFLSHLRQFEDKVWMAPPGLLPRQQPSDAENPALILMKAAVIQPVNSLRTLYVDLKELIRIYIKRAQILVVENCS